LKWFVFWRGWLEARKAPNGGIAPFESNSLWIRFVASIQYLSQSAKVFHHKGTKDTKEKQAKLSRFSRDFGQTEGSPYSELSSC
jgi:hypothetical protein